MRAGTLTLDPNMDIILGLVSLPCFFVGVGEGVYIKVLVTSQRG